MTNIQSLQTEHFSQEQIAARDATRDGQEILDRLSVMAQTRGGQLLSPEWIGIREKLRWQCAHGHQWDALPTNVEINGTWCPYCRGNARYTIEEVRQIAAARGVTLLSKTYRNNVALLEWQCSHGRVWQMSFRGLMASGASHRHCARCAAEARDKAAS